MKGPFGWLVAFGESRPWLVLSAVVLAGLGLPYLFDRDLWCDEIFQHYLVAGGPGEVTARLLTVDRNPPGLTVATLPIVAVSNEPKAIRLVSLAAGLLVIPLAWAGGRFSAGPAAGWACALLVTACPQYLFFSREARPYMLGVMWVFAVALGLLLTLRQPTRWRVAFTAIAVVGAVFTQHAASPVVAVLIAAASVWAARDKERWPRVRALAVIGGVFLVAAAVNYFVFAAPQMRALGTGTGDFLTPHYFSGPDPVSGFAFAIRGTVELIVVLVTEGHLTPGRGDWWWRLSLVLMVVSLAAGAVLLRKDRFGSLVNCWLVGVLAGFLVLAGLGLHPYGGIRHCLPLSPLILLAVAGGIGQLLTTRFWWGRILAELICLGLVGVMVGTSLTITRIAQRNQISELVPALLERMQAGDSVAVVDGLTAISVVNYLAGGDSAEAVRVMTLRGARTASSISRTGSQNRFTSLPRSPPTRSPGRACLRWPSGRGCG